MDICLPHKYRLFPYCRILAESKRKTMPQRWVKANWQKNKQTNKHAFNWRTNGSASHCLFSKTDDTQSSKPGPDKLRVCDLWAHWDGSRTLTPSSLKCCHTFAQESQFFCEFLLLAYMFVIVLCLFINSCKIHNIWRLNFKLLQSFQDSSRIDSSRIKVKNLKLLRNEVTMLNLLRQRQRLGTGNIVCHIA